MHIYFFIFIVFPSFCQHFYLGSFSNYFGPTLLIVMVPSFLQIFFTLHRRLKRERDWKAEFEEELTSLTRLEKSFESLRGESNQVHGAGTPFISMEWALLSIPLHPSSSIFMYGADALFISKEVEAQEVGSILWSGHSRLYGAGATINSPTPEL